ncbi:MAG: hypothetical protein KY458_10510 [Actinobacteria bacterium]|nr:hypothetical protein [Actinomycetota bacterium]
MPLHDPNEVEPQPEPEPAAVEAEADAGAGAEAPAPERDPAPGPEAGPEPEPEPEPEEQDMSVEALRARLAARGLVRTEPSVRIREVTPDQPRPAPAALATWTEPAPEAEEAEAGAAEALEPEPDGPRAPVRCPTCRGTTQVAVAATGFRCPSCDRVWRWAICDGCDDLALTVARQESWRCGACGHHTRSWWRTGTAARERAQVQERRREDAARRERERAMAAARRRRWKLVAAGVFLVVVTAGIAGVVTLAGGGSPAEHSRAACSRYERVRTQIVNGTLSAPAAAAELAEVRELANAADPDVAAAAAELAAAGRPGTAKYLIASTKMSDACAAAR